MPETTEANRSTKEAPRISRSPFGRRQFLKAAAVAAAAVPFLPYLKLLDPEYREKLRIKKPPEERVDEESLPPNLELEEKRREIEERFNIKIMSSREFRQKYSDFYSNGQISTFNNRRDNRPENLSYEHLLFLEKGLSLLPNHFNKPDKEGRQLLVVLNPTLGQVGLCTCGHPSRDPYPHAIALGVLDAHPEQDFNIRFMDLVHELTHSFISSYAPEDMRQIFYEPYASKIKQLLEQLEIPTEDSSQLLLKINQKLSPMAELADTSLFRLKRADVGKRLEDADFFPRPSPSPRQGLSDQEREKFKFYTMFSYGLGTNGDVPSEFIAVLSGHYIFGKSYFFENYGEFFDLETVEKLYNFEKEEIFRGKEY